MRISEEKKSKAYEAICNPIMDLRLKHKTGDEIDLDLFKLQTEIWKKLCETLGIEQP